MRIYIKNKIFSLGGGSSATDESGQPVFNIKGKMFSITRKKYIKALSGERLYVVRNKMWSFIRPAAYVMDADGNVVAKVRKEISFKRKYTVSGYDDINVEGDFFSFDLRVYRSGVQIGNIHRNITLIKDAFILDCDEKDSAFLVALVIAIDNIVDSQTG